MVATEVVEGSRLMKMAPERTKPLHNFELPTCLKWGNQRFLRCMKVDSNGEILSSSDPDRRSSGSDVDSDGKDLKFTKQRCLKSLQTTTLPIQSGVKSKIGGGQVGEFRPKLMLHLPTPPDKTKKIHQVPEEDESAVAAAVARPWNLRTRRAACKAPNETGGSSKLDENQHQSFSPHVSENSSPKSLRLRGLATMATNQAPEKRERCKFSTSLSREEIKEDIFMLTGNNPLRRPKKRSRTVQRQLDTLFPGLWLSEVTTDTYRVPDEVVETKKK